MSTRAKIAISAAVFLMLAYHAPQQGALVNTNERVRFYLAHALLTRGDISIDGEIERFGSTHDKSEREGHYYCDKPPMLSILSVPIIAPYHWMTDGHMRTDRAVLMIRLFLLAPAGVLCFWLLYAMLCAIPLDRRRALLVAAIGLLGTPLATFYSTAFAHGLAATLLLTFLYAVHTHGHRLSWGGLFLLGLLGGVTVVTEYQTALPLLLLSAALFLRVRRRVALLAFFVGGGAMAVLLGAYNQAAFGSPWSLAYQHLVIREYAEAYSTGLLGFSLPDPAMLWDHAFSRRVGVFTLSPFLLLAIPGVVLSVLVRRWLEGVAACCVLAYVAMIAAFELPFGGVSLGARYLVPVYPFMILIGARGLWGLRRVLGRRAGYIFATLGLYSVVLFAAAGATDPWIPELSRNPLADFTLPFIREGAWCTQSLLTAAGFPGGVSFALWMGLCAGVVTLLTFRALRGAGRGPGLLLMNAVAYAAIALSLVPERDNWDGLRGAYGEMRRHAPSDETVLRDHLFQRRYRSMVDLLLAAQSDAPKQ